MPTEAIWEFADADAAKYANGVNTEMRRKDDGRGKRLGILALITKKGIERD